MKSYQSSLTTQVGVYFYHILRNICLRFSCGLDGCVVPRSHKKNICVRASLDSHNTFRICIVKYQTVSKQSYAISRQTSQFSEQNIQREKNVYKNFVPQTKIKRTRENERVWGREKKKRQRRGYTHNICTRKKYSLFYDFILGLRLRTPELFASAFTRLVTGLEECVKWKRTWTI